MKLLIVSQIAFVALFATANVYGADALTVIDLMPEDGAIVKSSAIQIPEGYEFSYSLYDGNNDATKSLQHGVQLDFFGSVFTIVSVPPSGVTITNPFPDTLLVAKTYATLGRLCGPATFTAFASTPARAHLYVRPIPSDEQIRWLNGQSASYEVDVPANKMLIYRTSDSSSGISGWDTLLPCAVQVTTPSGISFGGNRIGSFYTNSNVFGNRGTYPHSGGIGYLVYREGSSLQSDVYSEFALTLGGYNAEGAGRSDIVIGPATVKFRTVTNSISSAYLGFFSARMFSANASYQSTGSDTNSGNTNTNSPPTRSFTLQLQRSTNLSDWETADNYYINETASNAFYRLKPVAQ